MATFLVTLTLDSTIVDNHQTLVNTVTATGLFTTGVTLQATSTSDDPSTPVDDPTIINLTVTPSIEITKTASVTDVDSSGGVIWGIKLLLPLLFQYRRHHLTILI